MTPAQIALVSTLLEGDEPLKRTARLVPIAARLACAAATRDRREIAHTLAVLDKADLHALVVLLASLVDVEQPLTLIRPGVERVVQLAAWYAAERFDVEPEDVLHTHGSRGTPARALARQTVILVAHRAGFANIDIARALDVDHTTVTYSLKVGPQRPAVVEAADDVARALGLNEAA